MRVAPEGRRHLAIPRPEGIEGRVSVCEDFEQAPQVGGSQRCLDPFRAVKQFILLMAQAAQRGTQRRNSRSINFRNARQVDQESLALLRSHGRFELLGGHAVEFAGEAYDGYMTMFFGQLFECGVERHQILLMVAREGCKAVLSKVNAEIARPILIHIINLCTRGRHGDHAMGLVQSHVGLTRGWGAFSTRELAFRISPPS
jgi:hypothetical protein